MLSTCRIKSSRKWMSHYLRRRPDVAASRLHGARVGLTVDCDLPSHARQRGREFPGELGACGCHQALNGPQRPHPSTSRNDRWQAPATSLANRAIVSDTESVEYAGRVPTPPLDRFIGDIYCLTWALAGRALHM
jgi:hypothetical protein